MTQRELTVCCAVFLTACSTCFSTVCAAEQTACNGDQACANANSEVGQCLCSHQSGDGMIDGCISEFRNTNALAMTYADCVQTSCGSECGL